MKIVVLGVGLVGRVMVLDLAQEPSFSIRAVDEREEPLRNLPPVVETMRADLRDPDDVAQVLHGVEFAVCAVPGFMGYALLKRVIEARIPAVDISFFPEDPFELNALALSSEVAAIVDCGVAPGLCNILAAEAARQMDSVEAYRCFVGGLPRVRRWPFEYAAVFSPTDVLEEYTRPARIVENSNVVIVPALSGREQIDLPGIGTLEAFNTDGLRTMLKTFPARNMVEKTLRYPGHADLMHVFREAGFLDKEPVQVGGVHVRPFDLAAELLRRHWAMRPGDEDLTVMRVEVDGLKDGRWMGYRYDLLDRFDPQTGTTAMARTTGYTATIVVRMAAEGLFPRPGILPPENLVQYDGFYRRLMEGYRERGITLKGKVLDEPDGA